MSRLFAFQSARASVVIVKQPTATLLRTSHGATASTQATSDDARGDPGRAGRRPTKNAQATSGRKTRRVFAEDREPADDAERAREPAASARSATTQRQQDERRREQLVEDLAVDVDVVPDEVRVQGRDDRRDDARRARETKRRPIS